MNNKHVPSMIDHYHQPDLTTRILKALTASGLDPNVLKCADLERLDEFHIRGKQVTRDLAELIQPFAGQQVLDLGCGIGGPARFLAQQYGCSVLGLDLVTSYCEAATVLTRLTGLGDLVRFQQGDMCEMSFEDASFDCVWSQHTLMNISDKEALASEIVRVLRPQGKAVIYEVCSDNGDPIHLPVAWAGAPEQSHLCGADNLRRNFIDSGMTELVWEDVTEISLAWFDAMVAGMKKQPERHRPLPAVGLLMGKDAALKSRNLERNLREGRVIVVQGVFQRS